MKLVTVSQMRELERIAIAEYGVPSALLMENAAAGFINALKEEVGSLSGKKIQVVLGKGNNAGDGLAIARMAHNAGAFVTLTPLFDVSLFSGDAKTNYEIVKKMGLKATPVEDCLSKDIVVDAIFGTGFSGEVTGSIKDAICKINESEAYVASVDIPSGVNADTGSVLGVCVEADLCVTFLALKPGHLLFPGKAHSKKLIKTDISVPRQVINETAAGYDVIDHSVLLRLPKRNANSHKGSFGKALAFVGAEGMSGAAVLSTSSILKSGAGMVCAAIPESIAYAFSTELITATTLPIPSETSAEDATKLLLFKLSSQDVLLAGCGLGTHARTKEILYRLIKTSEKPMVLDADALNLVAENIDILNEKKCDMILTPHVLEFSRLSGLTVQEIKENTLSVAKAFATKYNVTLVLKDAVTVVATKEGALFISTASNSGMATAGSGDVLAGIITALLAQGAKKENAAVLGVYLHLAAGELARREKGEYAMTAEDILAYLPKAFQNQIDISPNIKEL